MVVKTFFTARGEKHPATTLPHVDQADRAFLNTFIPDGWASDGFLAVVMLVSPEGESRIKVYNQVEGPLSTVVGMLRIAEHHVVGQAFFSMDDDEIIDPDVGPDDPDDS